MSQNFQVNPLFTNKDTVAAWLVQLIERQTVEREVEGLLTRTINRIGPVSCIYIVTRLARDVKERQPSHLSQRVGHGVPGVVVRPCLTGKCSD